MITLNTLGKEFLEFVPKHIVAKYFKERKKAGVKSRQFFTANSKILKNEMAEYKELPGEFTPVVLTIYGNKTVLIILAKPPIDTRGFLISWATPAAISPSAASFSDSTSLSWVFFSSSFVSSKYE